MILKELKKKAADKGRTLSSICDELGISRSVITRWEKEAPKSIKIYQRLQQAIDRL